MLTIAKHTPTPLVGIFNINATSDSNVQKENVENTDIHLSLNTEELIDVQNDETFCLTMLS